MATRNQTALFKRYRESLQNARRPFVATGGPGGGGSIELVEAPLLNQGGPRGYNAIVGDDPAPIPPGTDPFLDPPDFHPS